MPSTTRQLLETVPDTPAQVLAALRDEQDLRAESEVRSMVLAAHWVALHPVLDESDPQACFQSPKTLAGEGSPAIDEFCIPEVATMLGQTCDAVGSYLTDVIELRYRLPALWAGLVAGEVTPWRARRVAQTTVALTSEAASFVDGQVAWCANRLTPTDLVRLIDHARARFMPDELAAEIEAAADRRHVTFTTDQVSYDGTMQLEADLQIADALSLAEAVSAGAERLAALGATDTLDGRRATALGDLARHQLAFGYDTTADNPSGPMPATTQLIVHAHLPAHAITTNSQGLTGSIEQAGGRVLTADQIREWCGRPDADIVVKPVIDLHDTLATTGYVPTERIRDHVIARDRTCVFPWCGRNARGCDLDHVVPFDAGGPTSTDNLAALCRRHHRLKTHGRWSYTMPTPGVFVWTSPHGHQFHRDHTGSRAIPPDQPITPAAEPPDE